MDACSSRSPGTATHSSAPPTRRFPPRTFEPSATEAEIDFILATAAEYLQKPPTRADVLSVFTGIRPLLKAEGAGSTAALSRDHTIRIDPSGLLSIAGGKWTTYRHMAEDCVDQAETLGKLAESPCVTRQLSIHGATETAHSYGSLSVYGSDAPKILAIAQTDPSLAQPLSAALPYIGAEIVWACREELALSIEDVLARRTRALFLNSRAALEMAPRVAQIMARELGRDDTWQETQIAAFNTLAQHYICALTPSVTSARDARSPDAPA